MKTFTKRFFRTIYCLALGGSTCLFADSTSTPESANAQKLANYVMMYALSNGYQLPESWGQISTILSDDASLAPGQRLSESYSFIPESDRGKFSKGELLLISYDAMPAPKGWMPDFSDVDMETLTDEQRRAIAARLESAQKLQKPLRFFVYRSPEGKYFSDWEYEEEIQAMLKETGITIPRPTPYYPKGPDGEYLPLTPQAIEALVRTGLTDTIPPELAAKMQAAGTLPAPRAPRSLSTPGATAPAPATLALITSSPWTGWVALAVVLLAAILYLRRQHAKRQ